MQAARTNYRDASEPKKTRSLGSLRQLIEMLRRG
jgi:hypothetical protein